MPYFCVLLLGVISSSGPWFRCLPISPNPILPNPRVRVGVGIGVRIAIRVGVRVCIRVGIGVSVRVGIRVRVTS